MYSEARDAYAAIGIDTEKVLAAIAEVPVSINCWQGDDVVGSPGQHQLLAGR